MHLIIVNAGPLFKRQCAKISQNRRKTPALRGLAPPQGPSTPWKTGEGAAPCGRSALPRFPQGPRDDSLRESCTEALRLLLPPSFPFVGAPPPENGNRGPPAAVYTEAAFSLGLFW